MEKESRLEAGLNSQELENAKLGSDTAIDKFTDWYFRPRKFEESGRVYEAIGIKPLKRFCTGLCGNLIKNMSGRDAREAITNPENNYFLWDLSKKGLKKFESYTRINEAIHLFSTLVLISTIMVHPIFASVRAAINAYCIMLQRYNRNRLYKTIEKIKAKENKK